MTFIPSPFASFSILGNPQGLLFFNNNFPMSYGFLLYPYPLNIIANDDGPHPVLAIVCILLLFVELNGFWLYEPLDCLYNLNVLFPIVITFEYPSPFLFFPLVLLGTDKITFTLHCAVFPLVVLTVITASPGFIAVIFPVLLIVATLLFDVDHVNFVVAFLGVIVAFKVLVLPIANFTDVLSNFILVTSWFPFVGLGVVDVLGDGVLVGLGDWVGDVLWLGVGVALWLGDGDVLWLGVGVWLGCVSIFPVLNSFDSSLPSSSTTITLKYVSLSVDNLFSFILYVLLFLLTSPLW